MLYLAVNTSQKAWVRVMIDEVNRTGSSCQSDGGWEGPVEDARLYRRHYA
jgi:hypothetical protein